MLHKLYARLQFVSNGLPDQGQGIEKRFAGTVDGDTEVERTSEARMEPAQPIVADLEAMAQVADQGIVSKSIVENDHHKIIHFTFAPGQELSEHTASVPAVIHILRGRGVVVLDGVEYEAGPGKLYYMPADLRHAVQAREELVFLLTMFRT
jgi:quercetin dioxygenase-like cupin family protein